VENLPGTPGVVARSAATRGGGIERDTSVCAAHPFQERSFTPLWDKAAEFYPIQKSVMIPLSSDLTFNVVTEQ
jgi:hypothetical protein